ncbi:hypothetical protein HGRIS_013379 [Hohenbuehelia grisea]|uniref:Transcription activator of gluconeogenesis ERT1 n=1 Tax=Hohenbuehelia grisea TaxID=104357 RepID=A0ABR3IVE6_9AGAR
MTDNVQRVAGIWSIAVPLNTRQHAPPPSAKLSTLSIINSVVPHTKLSERQPPEPASLGSLRPYLDCPLSVLSLNSSSDSLQFNSGVVSMASNEAGKTIENDESHDAPSPTDAIQPSMTIHPVSYANMPMPVYSFPPGVVQTPPMRSKRRQVKNACTNCQKACKKCDDARPCLRCVKYGIAEECIDSQRKERKKGIKRGPYKKRDGKDRASGSVDDTDEAASPPGMPVASGMPPAAAAPAPMGYAMPPMGYHPGFYGYPAPMPRPGDGQPYYPPPFLMPAPHPQQAPVGPDGEPQGYMHPGYYPPFMPFPQYPYIMGPRPDGQMAPYPYGPPPPMYAKPPPAPSGSGDRANSDDGSGDKSP